MTFTSWVIIVCILLILLIIGGDMYFDYKNEKCCSEDFGEFYDCYIDLSCHYRSCFHNVSLSVYEYYCMEV